MRVHLPCKAPSKEPMELELISNFYKQRLFGGFELGNINSKLHSSIGRPQIHFLFKFKCLKNQNSKILTSLQKLSNLKSKFKP